MAAIRPKRNTNRLGHINERVLNRPGDDVKVRHHHLMEPAITIEIQAQSVMERQKAQR